MKLENCNSKNFQGFNNTEISRIGIFGLKCFSEPNAYQLKGTFYDDSFSYLELKLYWCNKTTTQCKSDQEINDFFTKNFQLNFAIVNSFFNFNDYGIPNIYD